MPFDLALDQPNPEAISSEFDCLLYARRLYLESLTSHMNNLDMIGPDLVEQFINYAVEQP